MLQTFKNLIAPVCNADELVAALQTERLTSIRINPRKIASLSLNRVPWCDCGFYVPQRPLFTIDPAFQAGGYYVQEASSMFLQQIISPLATRPLKVLDLCAAPGGKTTLTLSLLPEGSILVANEVIRSRSQILSENLIKWGNSNCIVTNNDPKYFGFLRGFFDLIIVDAPCSGEGMFRKNSDAFQEWSLENVDLCSKRQLRILYDIWDCLAPEGTLIYSTCTFNERENEDVVSRFVSEQNAECVQIPLQQSWNVTERQKNGVYSYRFFPHLSQGEGFSVSAIRKTEGYEYSEPRKIQQSKAFQILNAKNSADFCPLVIGDNHTFVLDKKNQVWAFPQEFQKLLCEVATHCNVVHAGSPVAELVGNKFNPLAGFAFSHICNSQAFPQQTIDLETAVRYFKKEPLQISDAPKGWILLIYNNLPIGFVKNIGNRANNPYPQEWAIKMTVDYSKLFSFV